MRSEFGGHAVRPFALALFMGLAVSGAGCDSQNPPADQPAAEGVRERKLAPQTKRVPKLNLKLPTEPEPVDVPALLREKRCYLCHDASRQKLGPSYEAIGLAHGARKEIMVEVLALKVVNGGGGNWGVIPMIANRHVNIEEARLMAGWILTPK